MTRRKRCDGPHAISIHSRDGNLVMRDADERHCAPQFFFHQRIESVCNRQRLHSAPDYRPPDEYEATLGRFQLVTSPPDVSIAERCY